MEERRNATFDTSYWINVFGAGLLAYVLERYALSVAHAVALELPPTFPSGREFQRLRLSGVIEVVAPRQDRIGVFGPGERGAVSLALEHRDRALLLDDLCPFVHAATLG